MSQMDDVTKRRGRPSDYREEFCDQVIELGKQGKSVVQIASALDCHKDSLYEWEKVYPDFSDALSRARQESQVWFENMGQSGLVMPGFNASLWNKQVSCRFPNDYREKQDLNLGGQNGVNPIDASLTVKYIKPAG
jgi:hypothetical protein